MRKAPGPAAVPRAGLLLGGRLTGSVATSGNASGAPATKIAAVFDPSFDARVKARIEHGRDLRGGVPDDISEVRHRADQALLEPHPDVRRGRGPRAFPHRRRFCAAYALAQYSC